MCQTPPGMWEPTRPTSQAWTLVEQGQTYCVRALAWDDHARHAAYQALRYRIFYEQLRWAVTVTQDGREVDGYDEQEDDAIHIQTVSQVMQQREEVVGGVRIFVLRSWQDSMVMREFRAAGLFPEAVLDELQARYPVCHLLEITRLCVLRRSAFRPDTPWTATQREIVQDLATASVYRVAEQSGRFQALAVVSAGYVRLLQRAGFVLHLCYTSELTKRTGYVLTIINLAASVQAMRQQGQHAKVRRLLALCPPASLLECSSDEHLV